MLTLKLCILCAILAVLVNPSVFADQMTCPSSLTCNDPSNCGPTYSNFTLHLSHTNDFQTGTYNFTSATGNKDGTTPVTCGYSFGKSGDQNVQLITLKDYYPGNGWKRADNKDDFVCNTSAANCVFSTNLSN